MVVRPARLSRTCRRHVVGREPHCTSTARCDLASRGPTRSRDVGIDDDFVKDSFRASRSFRIPSEDRRFLTMDEHAPATPQHDRAHRRNFLTITGIATATTVLGVAPASPRRRCRADQGAAREADAGRHHRADEEGQSALPPWTGVPARLPRPAEGQRQGSVSRRSDPELHRFPCARRDDHGFGHRRLLQCARGRQHRQRRHPREYGVCVQGGGCEGRAGDGTHVVRRDQGRDRQGRSSEISPGCSPRSAPPCRQPSIRANARPRTMVL